MPVLLPTLQSLGQCRWSSRATWFPNINTLADASVLGAPRLNVLLPPSVDPWSSYYALLRTAAIVVCLCTIFMYHIDAGSFHL